MFIIKPNIKIIATILAKNEADIISSTIEHHLENGVSKIILTDNGSTDQTKTIAASYPEVVEIIDEPGDTHDQSLWVTRMARMACKLNPDWIIHLDADEHWGGLMALSGMSATIVGCQKMYLHPPIDWNFDIARMKFYLDFDETPIIQECKIAHRPHPEITIEHGNHGAKIYGIHDAIQFTDKIWRHHYPIRSYDQWIRKSMGHVSLKKRGAVCDRWKMWHELYESGKMEAKYDEIITSWKSMIDNPNRKDFLALLEFWATPDMQQFFKNSGIIPQIGVR